MSNSQVQPFSTKLAENVVHDLSKCLHILHCQQTNCTTILLPKDKTYFPSNNHNIVTVILDILCYKQEKI